MVSNTPIIPFPPSSSEPTNKQLSSWASAVTVFLRTLVNQPNQAVQLPYLNSDSRASDDGILMFDPASGHVVVSVSGEWKKLEFVP